MVNTTFVCRGHVKKAATGVSQRCRSQDTGADARGSTPLRAWLRWRGALHGALAALQAQDIHKYSMQDIAEEQRIMAAKKELAQFDQYQVWHDSTPGFITDESEIPKHAIRVSSTYVERPKLTQKKKADGTLSTERELVCKGRLCSRGYEVAGFWGARTDAPTISRPAFLIFLTIC